MTSRRSSADSLADPTQLPAGDAGAIRRNSLWNACQQVANLANGSLFSIALAWVLPLDEYGVYSYAISLLTLGVAVTTAGLNGLGIKYCAAAGDRGGRVVATILLIREMFALAAFLVLGAISFTSHDSVTVAATFFALITLFFRALDAPEVWYMAHLRSRRTASVRLVTVAVMVVIRLVSLFVLPDLWVFIGIYLVEVAVMSVWILLRFRSDPDTPALEWPRSPETRSMMRESSPLALSGIADQINLRADILIIQPILGSAAVGIYSLATRFSELAYFLPIVIMNATLPVLLKALAEARQTGSDVGYRQLLQTAYNRAAAGGFAVAAVVTAICLSPLTNYVKPEMQPVFGVLAVHIWASPFVFMGAVYSKWIIAEGFLWSSLVRHSLGAVVNVALVFALLPRLGLVGAAWASVISYAAANYVACFVGSRSRRQGICMTRALFGPVLLLWLLPRRRYPSRTRDSGCG